MAVLEVVLEVAEAAADASPLLAEVADASGVPVEVAAEVVGSSSQVGKVEDDQGHQTFRAAYLDRWSGDLSWVAGVLRWRCEVLVDLARILQKGIPGEQVPHHTDHSCPADIALDCIDHRSRCRNQDRARIPHSHVVRFVQDLLSSSPNLAAQNHKALADQDDWLFV